MPKPKITTKTRLEEHTSDSARIWVDIFVEDSCGEPRKMHDFVLASGPKAEVADFLKGNIDWDQLAEVILNNPPVVRVQDLPISSDPSNQLYCSECDGYFSACKSDYFMLPAKHVMKCGVCNTNLQLVKK